MPNTTQEQIDKLIGFFATEKIMSKEDMDELLQALVKILAENKKGVEGLSLEIKEEVKRAVQQIANDHNSVLNQVGEHSKATRAEIEKAVKEQNGRAFKQLQDLINKTKFPKDGAPGKDADPEAITNEVLARIKLPENKVITAQDITAQLSTLAEEEKDKLFTLLGSKKLKGLEDTMEVRFADALNRVRLTRGVKEVVAGTNVTVSTDGNGVVTVSASGGGGGSGEWGDITGTLSDQTDLQSALDAKADALGADDNYVTDAEKTKLSNLSGTNSGDQNIFQVVQVQGQDPLVADSTADTLNITPGTGIQITVQDSTDTMTIGVSSAVYRSGGTDVALADGGTGASLSDPGADRIMAWDDSAGSVAFIALADLTDEASPATGDYLLMYGAEGDLRKVDWSELPSGGSGATTELDNLGTTAINASLLFDTDATYDIGDTTNGINDLHVGSGGVINFDGGDVTITHAANQITVAGGKLLISGGIDLQGGALYNSGGAEGGRVYINDHLQVVNNAWFNSSIYPNTSDGAALGSTTQMWSDLFLGSGGVINWNNGDLTLTHSSNLLTLGGGDLSLGANDLITEGEIRLDGTPGTDHTAVGPTTNTFNAGATITIMDLVYLASDGEWALADADAASTAGGMLAIALAGGTDGNSMKVALPGSFVRDDTWNWTPGATLYVSTTAGAITATAPSGTDDVIRVVGFAVTADVIYFNPSPDHITHA